uniref:Uncharacterized protein n=1 Tax=Plectus sambesii TaxID=2011161 RepID=A0A914WXL9_9BILA
MTKAICIENNSFIFGNKCAFNLQVTRLEEGGGLYRFQGVALPAQQRVSSYTWDILKKAAKRPNRMVTPGQPRLVHQHEPEQSKMELNR